MTKKLLKKGIVVFIVLAISLAPAFGAVCAMPCGNGGDGPGASCCCRPSGTMAAEVLTSPSCCTSEVKSYDPGVLARATVSGSALELSGPSVCTTEETTTVAGLREPTPHLDAPGNARSSPLFLLHAAFII